MLGTGSARRALSLGAALLALLAIVGLASRGHLAGAGGGRTRHVSTDIVLEYFLLLLVLGTLVLLPVIFMTFRQARDEPDTLPKRGNWMLRLLIATTLIAVALTTRALIRHLHHHHGQSPPGNPFKGIGNKIPQARPSTREAHFDLAPVIVVFSVAAVAVAAGAFFYVRARRRRRPNAARTAVALSDALDESLDDLRREGDARRAVIAAYARMERALAACGLPRRASEAPLEYLGRVLRDLLRASAASVARLTDLFEHAKFSQHEVGTDMKEEAIAALVAVRDELRAYS
jgi:hypothetical protein